MFKTKKTQSVVILSLSFESILIARIEQNDWLEIISIRFDNLNSDNIIGLSLDAQLKLVEMINSIRQ